MPWPRVWPLSEEPPDLKVTGIFSLVASERILATSSRLFALWVAPGTIRKWEASLDQTSLRVSDWLCFRVAMPSRCRASEIVGELKLPFQT